MVGTKPSLVMECLHISSVSMSGFLVSLLQVLHSVRFALAYFYCFAVLACGEGLVACHTFCAGGVFVSDECLDSIVQVSG